MVESVRKIHVCVNVGKLQKSLIHVHTVEQAYQHHVSKQSSVQVVCIFSKHLAQHT